MSKEENILNNLKKRQKPEVANGFFEDFADEMMAKVIEEESGLSRFKKTAKPAVSEDFFAGIENKIVEQSENKQVKSRVINLKTVGIFTAIAACLVVAFFLIPFNGSEGNEVADNNSQSNETEELINNEELLALMDEDDITNFLIENEDIDLESSTDSETEEYLDQEEIYYYLEEDLEELYIENL